MVLSAMSGFLLFLAMKTIPTRRLALGESSWNKGKLQNNFKSNQHLKHVGNLPEGWKMRRFVSPTCLVHRLKGFLVAFSETFETP